jgi:hypothetical protein
MPVSTVSSGPVVPAPFSALASGLVVLTGMFVSAVPSVTRTRVPVATLAAASTGLTASSVRVTFAFPGVSSSGVSCWTICGSRRSGRRSRDRRRRRPRRSARRSTCRTAAS